MRRIPLREIVLRHYTRTALVPILSIELTLLVLYFGVSSYINLQTERTLRTEVGASMPRFADQQAHKISDELAQISRQTAYFARAHAELLNNLDTIPAPRDRPEFGVAPSGALYQTNLSSGSSLYYAHAELLTTRQREKAEKTAALNPLYEHMVTDTPNVVAAYLNTPDNMNRLYPFIPQVYERYPADLHLDTYNFYYLADAKHDPSREPAWTGVYLDPAGNGWMLSCVAPVYVGEVLDGVVGLDVTTTNIVENILVMELPWSASAFLVDKDGMILAMSSRIEKLLGLTELKGHVYDSAILKDQLKPEEFNLFKNPNKALAANFRELFESSATAREVDVQGSSLFLYQAIVPQTGWHLFVVVHANDLFRSATEVERLAKTIGYGSIALMVAFYSGFFAFLRWKAWKMAKTLSRPIRALADAVGRVGNQPAQQTQLETSGVTEIDYLTERFNTMVNELDRRNLQLIESRVETKMKEKDAELAFAQGMFESASGYLHNVGNSITALDASLIDLREIVQSADQYPAVFARLRKSDTDPILGKFEQVLLGRTVPKLRASADAISRIRDSIQQTIRYQQHSFNAASTPLMPAKFDLSELLNRVCDEHEAPGHPIQREIAPKITLTNHRNQIYQGLVNLVKNAREATESSGTVTVRLDSVDGGARVIVRDTGAGIAKENLAKVLAAGFTTKTGGHGLGLHSFSIFLAAHHGELKVHSEGIGCGTTATVEVRHV